ncbi:MAG TPA: hypothetical protein DCS66_19370 [Flavobacteriaceae bacterium]|nr:hypothetical protein [Flavobacteriaceae bacterium]|tara:strand:+ start:16221 stop:16973 length:753 start_codon:yes stop_codon:yes gene_type:complete
MSKDVTDDGYEFMLKQKPTEESIKKFKAGDFKDYIPHILTDKQTFIQCFKYSDGKKNYIIPEPNPIVIYFSNAQVNLADINESRQKLMEALNYGKGDLGNAMNSFYNFFGHVSNYVTSLFNSLEAFMNHQIPNEFEYKRISKKKTEVYNKEQIQRELQFEEKIKKVIPQIKNKSFHRHFAHKFDIIVKFKEFRDEIVHTKVDRKTAPNYYKELFTKSLDFDYIKTIQTIKDYLNYYEPDLIEKCDCGADY